MTASSQAWLTGRVAEVPRTAPRSAAGRGASARVTAFAALALFGALRWGTMLAPAPTGRLLALVGVAVALAAVGPQLGRRSQFLAVGAAAIAAVGMLAICGLPLTWIRHVRLAVSARAVGDGLSALPRLLLPYRGVTESVRMVMLLGAGVLLFDAALMLAFGMPTAGAPRARADGDLRRAGAALPLLALAAVPLTLVPARHPYLQGLLVFVLLGALVWGERLPRGGGGPATAVCLVAACGAMVAAPALDRHRPWIDYQSLANGMTAGPVDTFDWSQSYKPLAWPQDGRQVLEVRAPHGADYWKAVDLDRFDGTRWALAIAPQAAPSDGAPESARRHWTQTLTVTVGAMSTSQVIGAGEMAKPTGAVQGIDAGASAGTWVTQTPLASGDTYTVRVYSPHPPARELRAAPGDSSDSALAAYRALTLPSEAAPGGVATVVFPAFGAGSQAIASSSGQDGAAVLSGSPYAAAYRLAEGLRAEAPTPYDYVRRIIRYLGHGYRYTQTPPVSRYPLLSFLFVDRAGYCQQFAGAMALLLRMGGVPARVAAGFTSGVLDRSTHRWLVSDYDAHAWVEAFFPGYGWVWFDPTPAADPALRRGTTNATPASAPEQKPSRSAKTPGRHGLGAPGGVTTATVGRARSQGAGPSPLIPLGSGVAVVLLLIVAWALRPVGDLSPEGLLAELERAFARSGRPLGPSVTLSDLGHRLRGTPEARGYIDALAQARFADAAAGPTAAQRRALRAQLRAGLGISGALRAWWALPPRPTWHRRRRV